MEPCVRPPRVSGATAASKVACTHVAAGSGYRRQRPLRPACRSSSRGDLVREIFDDADLCVIEEGDAELARSSFSRLRICACTETSSAESARRRRSGGAPPPAPGRSRGARPPELVTRVARQHVAPQANLFEQRGDALRALGGRDIGAATRRLPQGFVGASAVERRERVLKTICAANVACATPRRSGLERRAFEQRRVEISAVVRRSWSTALPTVVLPLPSSPTSASVRRRDAERHAVDGLDVADGTLEEPLADREPDAVIADSSTVSPTGASARQFRILLNTRHTSSPGLAPCEYTSAPSGPAEFNELWRRRAASIHHVAAAIGERQPANTWLSGGGADRRELAAALAGIRERLEQVDRVRMQRAIEEFLQLPRLRPPGPRTSVRRGAPSARRSRGRA